MASPKETVWALEPHTAAKHAILTRYFAAWLPILSQGGYREIAYIDAFAGPGSYSAGEDGSPILALKAMLSHNASIAAHCHFDFIECDPARAAALKSAVESTTGALGSPHNASIEVHQSTFEAAYPTVTAKFGRPVVPTLAFIDPFGWTGLPFRIVSDLLGRPSTEVFINFMFEEINRFLDHPAQGANFDDLFGCSGWRDCISQQGRARNNCIRDLYASQLATKARYVRFFEMRNRSNATDYYLFFATNNILGLRKMKEAMWKIDQGGAFSFSDATDQNQLVMLVDSPNFDVLKNQIIARFSGSRASVEAIEEFVVTSTAFRETHFKKQVLKPLEAAKEITIVQAKPGRKTGSYPPGTVISFA